MNFVMICRFLFIVCENYFVDVAVIVEFEVKKIYSLTVSISCVVEGVYFGILCSAKVVRGFWK